MAPTPDAKGITNRLIAKAVNRGKPIRLSKGILTEPPPIPNMPLIKPARSPMAKNIIICVGIVKRHSLCYRFQLAIREIGNQTRPRGNCI